MSCLLLNDRKIIVGVILSAVCTRRQLWQIDVTCRWQLHEAARVFMQISPEVAPRQWSQAHRFRRFWKTLAAKLTKWNSKGKFEGKGNRGKEIVECSPFRDDTQVRIYRTSVFEGMASSTATATGAKGPEGECRRRVKVASDIDFLPGGNPPMLDTRVSPARVSALARSDWNESPLISARRNLISISPEIDSDRDLMTKSGDFEVVFLPVASYDAWMMSNEDEDKEIIVTDYTALKRHSRTLPIFDKISARFVTEIYEAAAIYRRSVFNAILFFKARMKDLSRSVWNLPRTSWNRYS